MLQEIENVRVLHGGVEKRSMVHVFTTTEMKKIHNKYMDSLTWMNPQIRREYDDLEGSWRQFKNGRFNVHFSNQ